MRSTRLALVATVLTTLAPSPGAAAQPRVHTILLSGIAAGEQVVAVEEDGVVRIRNRFNDRGRGPDTEAVYRLDEAGIPVEIGVAAR